MWLPPWTSMGAMGVQSTQWCQWLQRGGPHSHTKSCPCQLITKVWRCSQGFDGKFCLSWEPKAAMLVSKNMVESLQGIQKKKKRKELSVLDFYGWEKLTTDVSILNNSKFSCMGIPVWTLHSWCEHKQWTGETKTSLQVCIPSRPQK